MIDPPMPTRRVVIVNKPDSVQTEVRVGHIGIPRNHPDYMAVNLAIRILGGEGSNRLHQVLRTAARAHLRRAGELRHVQGERRLRGRNQHAHRSHRRGAAADRRRVLAAAARARQRARAVRRQGIPDRQLPADDRNAGRDRDAGAERAVLRAADRRAPVLPRARERRDASTTSSAWPGCTSSPIGSRSCWWGMPRRSPTSSRGSVSDPSKPSRSSSLDLSAVDFQECGPRQRSVDPRPAVLRRAVGRPVRRRPDRELLRAASRTSTSSASAVPHSPPRGGGRSPTIAGLSVTGLTEAIGGCRSSWRRAAAVLEAARATRPDVFVRHRLPDFNFTDWRAARPAGHSRRRITSARSCGRGAAVALEDDARDRDARARDLSVRGSHLPEGGRAGRVRRASAGRSGEAVASARGIPGGPRAAGGGADRGASFPAAARRSVAHSAGPRGGGDARPRPGARRAVRRRARRRTSTMRCSRSCDAGLPQAVTVASATPTTCWRPPTSR